MTTYLEISFHELIITSFKYIPIPSRNNFILILIVGIPNEPLEIIMSDTQDFCTLSATYVANATSISYHIIAHSRAIDRHTSCQSRRSYTVLLTQADENSQHMPKN